MNINKILWFVSICVLSLSLAYFINGFIIFKTSIPLQNNLNTVQKKSRINNSFNPEIIYNKNIFGLEIDNKKLVFMGKNINDETDVATTNFKGKLLGIINGNDKSFAIIKMGKDLIVLEKGVEKKGLLLSDVFKNSVKIKSGDETHILKFEKITHNNFPVSVERHEEIQNKEIRVNSDKIVIPRVVLVSELQDINKVLRSVLVSPSYKNGKFQGYRVSRLKINSIFRKIGIRNGDIIVKINGENLTTPEKLFEFFSKTEDITAVTVDLIRHGKKKSLFIEID